MGKHVTELAAALASAAVELHIVTPCLSGGAHQEQVAPNVTVYRVPIPRTLHEGANLVTFARTSNTSLALKARDLQARLGSFDLVHAHDWLVAYSAVTLKYTLRLPLVVTVHSMERGRGQGQLDGDQALAINGTEWWLTYEAWRVIAVSTFMAEELCRYFQVPRDKVDVIYNGVRQPTTASIDAAERLSVRRRYAEDGRPIVFYVGRIVREKGIHILIDAAPRILAGYGPVKFVVAGTGSQIDLLRRQVWERDLQDSFHFTGFIVDGERDRLYQAADVAVFPSLYEPFGIVVLEAMIQRCPVIVAATGGLSELVRLHETGLTCHPGNPESLAWAVLETLRHPDWARARAENAYREVVKLYDWGQIAQKTIGTYRRVQQESRQFPWS
jgi:glycosyltransferase involved in cell wall biosynthesis